MSDDAEKGEPKRGRGRPRREGADGEILAVARELLRTIGYRDFTVDAVTERTGIAKTTIYRRWPTKAALVGAALAARPVEAPPPAATFEADLVALLASLRTRIELVDAEPELREVILQRPLFDAAIDRAIARGELSDDVDRELIVDLATSALWFRRDAGDELPTMIVRALLGGLRRR